MVDIGTNFLWNAGKDLFKWLNKKFEKPNLAEIQEKRIKWKNEFEEKLDYRNNNLEVMIRDIERLDEYPDVSESPKKYPWSKKRKLSPSFRVEFLDTYHKGFRVFLQITFLIQNLEDKTWKQIDDGEKGEKIYVIGKIPYENIVSVDWDGDRDWYPMPHIFCHFTGKNYQPYEDIIICRQKEWNHPNMPKFFYEEVGRWADVIKN